MLENKILELLTRLNLVDEHAIGEFYQSVRDQEELAVDIKVMRCSKSGIIFLSRTDHINFATYEDKDDPEYFKVQGENLPTGDEKDDDRRAAEYRNLITGMDWLDFGAGFGWLLERLGPVASSAMGIEAGARQRDKIAEKGFDVFATVEDLGDRTFDVISLFHVFEHLTDPIHLLKTLKKHLRKDGVLVIEVPHAHDALIDRYDCEAFKDFTFWSEHLILHTRESLSAFIRDAGFQDVVVNGYQRYPLSNHLHWLARQKPGGHYAWRDIDTEPLRIAYADALKAINQTDTIVAIAKA